MTKRLTPGACRASVQARADALETCLRSGGDPQAQILAACKSIAAFQRLSVPRLGITPFSSRNTLIKHANLALNDSSDDLTGWEYLNALRQRVATKFQATNARSQKAREQRRRDKLENLEGNLEQTERLALAQSKAYLSLLQDLAGLARARTVSKEMRERLFVVLKSHNETFGHLFDPGLEVSKAETNVVNIRST